MNEQIKEWNLFKGSIEVVIEAETRKEAEDTLSEMSHQIINQWENIYKTRYTKPKEE